MTIDPASLVAGVNAVYSLPRIYYRIDEAINDPLATSTRIGHIISEDVGLSARLLKVVNSGLYGWPNQVETISRAVSIIGIHQLRDLILATSVTELFDGIPDDLINMELFWRHSIACGVAARIVATYRHETNVEKYFVGGLLHDIGSLVIYAKLPEVAREILLRCQRTEELLDVVEKETLGFDHNELGGLLLQQWQLPSSLVDMARCHHQPLVSNDHPIESTIIHVADFIAHGLELGASGERYVPRLDREAWQRLGLSEGIISSIVPLLDKQYKDAVRNILGEGQA